MARPVIVRISSSPSYLYLATRTPFSKGKLWRHNGTDTTLVWSGDVALRELISGMMYSPTAGKAFMYVFMYNSSGPNYNRIYSFVPGIDAMTLEHEYYYDPGNSDIWGWGLNSAETGGYIYFWQGGYYSQALHRFDPTDVAGSFEVVCEPGSYETMEGLGGVSLLGSDIVCTDGASFFRSSTGAPGSFSAVYTWPDPIIDFTPSLNSLSCNIALGEVYAGFIDQNGSQRELWMLDSSNAVFNEFSEAMGHWHVIGQTRARWNAGYTTRGATYAFSWGEEYTGVGGITERVIVYIRDDSLGTWQHLTEMPNLDCDTEDVICVTNTQGVTSWRGKFYMVARYRILSPSSWGTRLISWDPASDVWQIEAQLVSEQYPCEGWGGSAVCCVAPCPIAQHLVN